ncbi:unnamed protein product [Cyprideis torosa]|uniref:Uncharacterized protein n=1 Tax=Cyprideis torosa TaxID=163714 RepID=A0A7R8WF62_9CRUS|nr:unnamed protein product [Cyprideis torosa]CAG0890267.1 unnamed protein product [Cyprideis torosa]
MYSMAMMGAAIAKAGRVLKQFKEEGVEFLLEALESPSKLEELTGLSELLKEVDENELWELEEEGMFVSDPPLSSPSGSPT